MDYELQFEVSFKINDVESSRSFIGTPGGCGTTKTRVANDNLYYEDDCHSGYDMFDEEFKKIAKEVKLTVDEYIELVITVLFEMPNYF